MEAAQPMARGTPSLTRPWQIPPMALIGGALPVWQPLTNAHCTEVPANRCRAISTEECRSVAPRSSSKANQPRPSSLTNPMAGQVHDVGLELGDAPAELLEAAEAVYR